MKVILASSEIVPFAKTGGLADVTGALPGELKKFGHQVTVFMPAYRCALESGQSVVPTEIRFEIPLGNKVEPGRLLKSQLPESKVNIYLVEHAEFFDRDGVYGELGHDYEDNCERYTFFCRSVLESIRLLDLSPDVIHVNDWQTALIPALLKCEFSENPIYRSTASLLTIHNLAYQGTFDYEKMAVTGLDLKYFNWQQMEFYGLLNLLKTGIVFADSINTVSPTYAQEIQTVEQGCGLEGVLQDRADRLSGIINGIDVSEWNPKTDPHIAANFDAHFDPQIGSVGKLKCKQALQLEAKLEPNSDTPVIGIVGRLEAQKGWSLILQVLKQYLATSDAQWIILGTGDPDYHHVLTSLHRSHPNKLALSLAFSDEFAHRIEAGADMFLMPSEFEPCGLNQMYSMAYGTVPIVRRTGGLADTVVDATPKTIENQTANGFSFDEFSSVALQSALDRAVRFYHEDRLNWNRLMLTGMRQDWSWKSSAKKYEQLYQETTARASMAHGH